MRKHAPLPMTRWVFTKLLFHMAFVFQFIPLLCNSFLLWMLHLVNSSLTHGGRSLVVCRFGCLSMMGTLLLWMSFFICTVYSLPPIMGILNFFLGIRSLESSVASLLPFVTESCDISSFLDLDGKPCLMTCGVRSHGCYENGKSLLLVHVSFLLIKLAVLGLLFFDLLFPFFFGSFLSSVVGGMLPRTNKGYLWVCLHSWQFRWAGWSSSSVGVLPWTRAFCIHFEENFLGGEE